MFIHRRKSTNCCGKSTQSVIQSVNAIFRREGVNPPELKDILQDQDELSGAFGKYSEPYNFQKVAQVQTL